MKNILVIISIIGLIGCSPRKETVHVINGQDGANGHSTVSQVNQTSELECTDGGSRVDIYLDMDDSLLASEGDLYEGSFVSCNGSNGLNGEHGIQGEQGPQGLIGPQGLPGEEGSQGPIGLQGPQGDNGQDDSGATITPSTSTCTLIVGNYYTKNNVLYLEDDNNHCDGSHDKIELSSIGSLWVFGNKLVVFDGSVLRTITFN